MLDTFSSTILSRSSDSPVSEELFTFISFADRRITSAGTLSPPLNLMMSPGTRFFDSYLFHFPSRKTKAVFGIKFLKSFMREAALDVCQNEKVPVTMTTRQRTIPKKRLSIELLSRPQAIKQRKPPIQSSRQKNPVNSLSRRIYQGNPFFSDKLFSPYVTSSSSALAVVKPCSLLVWNFSKSFSWIHKCSSYVRINYEF